MKKLMDYYSELGCLLVFGGMILWIFHILACFI